MNCSRPIENDDENVTIVDVVKHEDLEQEAINTNNLPSQNQQQTSQEINGTSSRDGVAASSSTNAVGDFVYDLYVADTNEQTEFDDNLYDNLIRFAILGHVHVFGTLI